MNLNPGALALGASAVAVAASTVVPKRRPKRISRRTRPQNGDKKATLQWMFDVVWNHFVTTRHAPGLNERGTPVMVVPSRPWCRCAAGLFLTPKLAKTCVSLGNGNYADSFTIARESGLDAGMLGALMSAHDIAATDPGLGKTTSFRSAIRKNLTWVAQRFGLRIPEGA